MKHVLFTRPQLLAIAEQLKEFPDIYAIDYVFDEQGHPIRMEYIWEDEE